MDKYYKNFLRNLNKDSKILDVGCGKRKKKLTCKVVELDIQDKYNPDITADFGKVYKSPARYDAIIMTGLLEHIHHPQIAIKNAYRALKPKGKLLLHAVFNQPIHNDPQDYFRFTGEGIRIMLEDEGFKVLEIEPIYDKRYKQYRDDIEVKSPSYFHTLSERP